MIHITKAIESLRPNTTWIIRGDSFSDLEWLDETQSQPTEAEVLAEVSRLEAEYAATEYQRLRAREYPPMSDFADAYYWMQKGKSDLMDVYVARCEAVKQKYPK